MARSIRALRVACPAAEAFGTDTGTPQTQDA
ncbi:DUF971 domain-containing protein, partial [Desulfovibrio oxamicus]|nr:DUF971 domain-containing protein [Nitratidesulfovibrio oxamicus]